MAVDTRNKRAGAILVGIPWRGMLPLPDGAIDQADRQQTAFFYPGILAGAPVILPPAGPAPPERSFRVAAVDQDYRVPAVDQEYRVPDIVREYRVPATEDS